MPMLRWLEQSLDDLLQPKEIDHSYETTASQSDQATPSQKQQNGDGEDAARRERDPADAPEHDRGRIILKSRRHSANRSGKG
jgi:hypothetical protein